MTEIYNTLVRLCKSTVEAFHYKQYPCTLCPIYLCKVQYCTVLEHSAGTLRTVHCKSNIHYDCNCETIERATNIQPTHVHV